MEIFMSVGVSEGRLIAADVCIAVGGIDVTVGGEDGAVGNTWTEKLQAPSTSVVRMKLMSNRNDLSCSKALSLSALLGDY